MNGRERFFGFIGSVIAITGLYVWAASLPIAPHPHEVHQKVVAGANHDLSPLSVPLERDASAGAPRRGVEFSPHRTGRLEGDGHGETVVHLRQATYVQRILGAVPISAPRYSARTAQETATARTVCLLVTFDLCQSATKCAGPIIGDTSVEFSHVLTGSSTPLTKSVRIDRNNHAEWTAIVPFEATGSTSGYQFAATGKPSERSVTFPVYCPPKTAKAAAAMKAAAGRPTLAVSSQASLRDAALKNAQEELWTAIEVNPTNPTGQRAPLIARAIIQSAVAGANPAASGITPSTSPVDCRASIASPSSQDTSATATAWRASIAEADANCATAERWRAAINASPRPQWVRDAYAGALRNHGDVVRGWLATVQQTGDPSYSPLRWMCEHGLDSPLWWTVQQITSDRPANIKYTQVRISTVAHGYPISDFTITLNDPHRQVTAYGLPEFDPACTRCTFLYWTPCMADTITSAGWEQVAPGRVEAGPK
jgi:hypothetical protein